MKKSSSRRRFLEMSALGGTLAACKPAAKVEEKLPSRLGKPVSGYGERAPSETAVRWMRTTRTPEQASSMTPHQDLNGIVTPSALHYERHHSGVPRLDPATHKLLIHGMVERPLIFTMDELHRLPSVSRIHFLECAGNTGSEWPAKTAPEVQQSHGLARCSEWTGVPLSLVLAECGVKPGASWILAEGADPCHMSRSVPLAKCMDDVLLAYGQNGEAIRPEQGYPLRLFVPGWEGNISVKWLRRIKVVDGPTMTRDETSKYTDLMPDGTARKFTFEMEAKSVITYPSGGQKLNGPGFCEVKGVAWSGRGRIERVECSVDGGKTWKDAQLQEPRLRIAFTRFRFPWNWDGAEALLVSRCTDETGYVQPSKEELIAVRGVNSNYHYNGTKLWHVAADGSVTNV